jgi:hypothetical protein
VIAAGADHGPGPLDVVPPVNAFRLTRLGPRGLAVEIRHARGGLRSIYAHLSSYKVRVGQRVEAGDLLGYVGRTGMQASTAHLHLGLFRGRVPLDPLDHLGALVLSPALSRQWWDTVYPRLAERGLPIPYERPAGIAPLPRERHELRPPSRRASRHRWQRRAAASGARGEGRQARRSRAGAAQRH